ncbi:hypothetical protein PUN28_004727 [Cardiocondyla obscurior]|uniref:Uncharacterized protein n=1 Tax=Cardiocondyla obscurior TaxID=286306 RepID=A0AAW2GFD3_9HYME
MQYPQFQVLHHITTIYYAHLLKFLVCKPFNICGTENTRYNRTRIHCYISEKYYRAFVASASYLSPTTTLNRPSSHTLCSNVTLLPSFHPGFTVFVSLLLPPGTSGSIVSTCPCLRSPPRGYLTALLPSLLNHSVSCPYRRMRVSPRFSLYLSILSSFSYPFSYPTSPPRSDPDAPQSCSCITLLLLHCSYNSLLYIYYFNILFVIYYEIIAKKIRAAILTLTVSY